MPKVKPEILVWAREIMRFSVADAARKLGFEDTEEATAEEQLLALERGEQEPTQDQLWAMSQKYLRSLTTLYLGVKPMKQDYGEDFRVFGSEPHDDDVYVEPLLRNIKTRQGILRDTLEEEEEAVPVPFIGTADINQGVERTARQLEELLQFDLEEFRRKDTIDNAFAYLRELAENQGVYVLLMGDHGTDDTIISPGTFRSYALADEIAPFIVINDHDARLDWPRTLLHEMAHLLLGRTGMSNACDQGQIKEPPAGQQVEEFCSAVVSQVLPTKENAQQVLSSTPTEQKDKVSTIRYKLGKPLLQTAKWMLESEALSVSKVAILLKVGSAEVDYVLHPDKPQYRGLR